MSETKQAPKIKVHPFKDELLQYIATHGHEYVGPSRTNTFAEEILERIEYNVVSPNLKENLEATKKIAEFVNSDEYHRNPQMLAEKIREYTPPTSIKGSRESGRLFSAAWIKRIQQVEKSCGYELLQTIYVSWIAFCMVFTEKRVVSTAAQNKAKVALLEAEKEILTKELEALTNN